MGVMIPNKVARFLWLTVYIVITEVCNLSVTVFSRCVSRIMSCRRRTDHVTRMIWTRLSRDTWTCLRG